MTLLEAWKDSLQLCKPQAIKLMLLATVNAMKQALKALCKPWFLVPMALAGIVSWILRSVVVALSAYGFAIWTLFLAVRPSMEIKNWAYFKKYYLYFLRFIVELLLWMVAIFACLIAWEYLFVPFGHTHSLFATKKILFTPINYIATFPALFFAAVLWVAHSANIVYYAVFFYLDKVGGVFISFKKALTLLYYNVPMIVLYTGIIWAVKFVFQTVPAYLLNSMLLANMIPHYAFFVIIAVVAFGILPFIAYLFSFCLISNIYTKRVHDQYALYQ